MTSLKPQFVVKNGKPFGSHLFPRNQEAKRLCEIAEKDYLSSEEAKTLLMLGIEISYLEEEEDGTLSA